MLKPSSMIVPTVFWSLLAVGCQSGVPTTGDLTVTEAAIGEATAFPASRTATLWVQGLICPY